MTFAHPLLVWGATLAIVPPLLHLLARRRAKPYDFAAIDFLLRAERARSRELRWKRVLLMVARMLVLAAVPLSLAQPRWAEAHSRAAAEGPRATALVVDESGSMRFHSGRSTLFELAIKAARTRLADLRLDEPGTVVLCGPQAPPPPRPTGNKGELFSLLGRARPSEEHVDLALCIEAANQLLANSGVTEKRIVVFTDLQQTDWDLGSSAASGAIQARLEVVDVAGKELPNLSLSHLEVSPAPSVGPNGFGLTVLVRNFSKDAVGNVPVVIRTRGKTLARGFADLDPYGQQRKTLSLSLAPGETFEGEVALESADGLSDDDSIPLVVPVPRQVHVLIVDGSPSSLRYSDEAFFVETALEASSGAILTQTIDADHLTADRLEHGGADVVVLLNVRAPSTEVGGALRRMVERGGGLLLAMGDRADPDAMNSALGSLLPAPLRLVKTAARPPGAPKDETAGAVTSQTPAHFASVDYGSTIFKTFVGASDGLLDTQTYRYVLTEAPTAGTMTLLAFDDGAPALLLSRHKDGNVLCFTSSLAREWSDWPIRASFVPVVQQMIFFLAKLESQSPPPVEVTGSTHHFAGKQEGRTVHSPSGLPLPLVAAGDGWDVRLSEVGIQRVTGRMSDGGESGSVNDIPVAFDPRESDTRRVELKEIEARYGGLVAADTEPLSNGREQFPLWTQILLVGLAAFLCEALLAG